MKAMKPSSEFPFDDLQGLLRYGHGKLIETSFLLLNIVDATAAQQWLSSAPVTSAIESKPHPKTALQIAFSVNGLKVLGLPEHAIAGFSDEFIVGMSGDESRSRRLGDIAGNAPDHWDWGGSPEQVPHVLLLLYAGNNALNSWRKKIENKAFKSAFVIVRELPTQHIGDIEPFGFADGISQPKIDWAQRQSTDSHQRDDYSNLLAPGEVVLGYPNEYKQYTVRPVLNPKEDSGAEVLPDAADQPGWKDFARNGSYLVLRQLGQDVAGFWQFMQKAAEQDGSNPEQLAATMVGRQLDGTPLMPLLDVDIPGIALDDQLNRFHYVSDPNGNVCPVGAHVRRANPRTGDLPPGGGCVFGRLMKILGFAAKGPNSDLIASTRFHRLLRRGRPYGPRLSPGDAMKPAAANDQQPRGLQFMCLVANISRQFEFVQNAWVMNSSFAGLQQERDPLLAHREPLKSGVNTDHFNRPDSSGPMRSLGALPQFITVRGGGYFFMPGLSAIKYLASLPIKQGVQLS